MNSSRFISEKIYLFTLFIWVLFASLVTTTYFVRVDGFLSLYRILLSFTIVMITIKEFINLPDTINYFRYHLKELIIFLLFTLTMLIVSKNRDGLPDINVLLLVFSARDIEFKKLLGTFSFATFLVLFVTILASKMGIISNMLMSADSGYRYSLGFNYVSFAQEDVENTYFSSRLRIEKMDAETGETIFHDGALFRIYAAKRDVKKTGTGTAGGSGQVLFGSAVDAEGKPVKDENGKQILYPRVGADNSSESDVPIRLDEDGIPLYDESQRISQLDENGIKKGIFRSYSTLKELVIDGRLCEVPYRTRS